MTTMTGRKGRGSRATGTTTTGGGWRPDPPFARIADTPTMPLPAAGTVVFDKFGMRPRTETWARPVRRVYCLLDGHHSVRDIAAILHMDMMLTLRCFTWLIERGYIIQLADERGRA